MRITTSIRVVEHRARRIGLAGDLSLEGEIPASVIGVDPPPAATEARQHPVEVVVTIEITEIGRDDALSHGHLDGRAQRAVTVSQDDRAIVAEVVGGGEVQVAVAVQVSHCQYPGFAARVLRRADGREGAIAVAAVNHDGL
jgi:hypothetical protein